MTDLYAFRATRSARRVEPDADVLPLVYDEMLPGPLTHVAPPVTVQWGGGTLVAQLLDLVADTDVAVDQRAAAAKVLADARLGGADAVDEGMLAGDADPLLGSDGSPSAQPFPGQGALHLLVELDHWLVSVANRPKGADLDARLAGLVHRTFDVSAPTDAELLAQTIEKRPWLHGAVSPAWGRLVDCLAAALLLRDRGELAQRLTRLLLVAGVIDRRSHVRAQLEPELVHRLVSKRTPLLPAPPFPEILPLPQVQLVRQAAVSDLFVVRREWRCYVAGEIAQIRNVLDGEHQDHKTTKVDEREVVEVGISETESTTESSSESTGESSFSEETSREMDLDLHADGQVDVSGQYGPTHVAASAGFTADFSLEDSTNRAVTVAQRATSRAASRVANRTRSERTERLLTRFEDFNQHLFENNGGNGHVRGVYRWVNRIDRLQVWRYPDRMQLEFELPEPGRFLLRQLSEQPHDPAARPKPPDFDVNKDDITREGYLELAAKYGATGLPEPPEETLGVSETIALASTDPLPNNNTELWNAKSMSGRVELAIPPGYVANGGSVRVGAAPIHAVWRREVEVDDDDWQNLERFHTITAFVAVGDELVFEKQVGPDETKQNTIQLTGTSKQPQYTEAFMDGSDAALTFEPPLVAKAPVTLTVTGAASATLAIELECTLTDQAQAQWVQDVFDGLRSAYDTELREWRAEQSRTGLRGRAGVFERSPLRHQELIREELKRHVVGWLLGESPFQGRPAVAPEPTPGPGGGKPDVTPDIDVPKALAAAPDIQFLEQALEWTNLTYVTYPYYWADRRRWPDLADLETVDPELGRFLRAGSARVIVPARPGFATAVQHWLLFRQPWVGGPAPTPGQPLYISMAKEIRDQTEAPEDGVPAESWEIMLPTTLLWLDEEANLPYNPLARLGKVPHEPKYPLCTTSGTDPHG
jgi:hypothetical protein